MLLPPMANLFNEIYHSCKVPDQWKVAKIIPTFKKGNKCQIENYRPIANLCSASKIFEKLILKQIQYFENTNKLDLTGRQQHGFKRKKSTATAGALLQSLIARAADNNCFVVMASLDLSMAFDMVDTGLLIKRLRVLFWCLNDNFDALPLKHRRLILKNGCSHSGYVFESNTHCYYRM